MASPRRIPFQETVNKAYHFSFNNFWYFLQISWLGYLIIFFNNLIFLSMPNSVILVIFVTVNVFVLSWISIAWHRKILEDETVTSSAYIRTDGLVIDYFGFAFILTLPSLVLAILFSVFFRDLIGASFFYLILSITIYVVISRLSLGLPGKALGWPGKPFARIWQMTEGNTLIIFAGYLACTIPVFIVIYMVSILTLNLLALPAFIIGMVYATAASLSFMTFAFQYLFEPENNEVVVNADQ